MFNEKDALDIENKFKESKVTYNFGENWYRYAHRNIGKMTAIEIISKNKKVPICDIIAFGDDYNDIEMIKNCGIGIAMENGIDEIKKTAKYVCGNNNDGGLGKWIDENII